jgi:predicted transglutaminase-like cysteine proteinase
MPAPSLGHLKQFVVAGTSLAAFAALVSPASAATLLTWLSADPSRPAAQTAETPTPARPAAAVPAAQVKTDKMGLGEAAPAPLGYLRFCARRPDQCGLEGETWSSLNAMTVDDRADQLLAKYYWSVAFASGPSASLNLSPAAGDTTPAPSANDAAGGRYDWSAIFGPTAAAASTKASSVVAQLAPADAAVAPPQASPARAADGSVTLSPTEMTLASAPRQAANDVDAVSPDQSIAPVEVAVWGTASPADPGALAAQPALTGDDAQPLQTWVFEEGALNESSNAADPPASTGLLTWAGKPDAALLTPAVLTTVVAAAQQTPAQLQESAPAATDAPGAALPAPIVMDRPTSALLNQVNLRINRAIRFVSDRVQYGVDDYWTLPLDAGGSGAGECKDYVLEKRRALIEAGIPAADLSIAIVKTTWGETHAVLLVATDRGEVVLDSLSSQIVPWRKAPYQWVERQAPGEQLAWVKVVSRRRWDS